MTDPIRDAAQALLPCPFCGGAPLLEDCRTIWVVRCSCKACVLGERAQEPDGSEPAGHWERIRQTAIEAWNRRAALSAPQPAADGRVAEHIRLVQAIADEAHANGNGYGEGYWLTRQLSAVESSARALLTAGPEDVKVTEEMITAYLEANDAYWIATDKMPRPPGKWRTGTPREATRASLTAALAAMQKGTP